ncbi:MAG TPA: cyclic nucleotide-binding domain-containing protein, partial [Polyangiaceae bacterium LLY-WYZ-15_(1-7)]|nr:cyclic nucleotide-binding domain-containing protein [Polyangiaceae bacterium LLY-WYZ-15_(1-7)]
LVDAFVRRGDLPEAVVAARTARVAGEDGDAALERIAEAFGEGSERLGDAPPTPPPLPSEIEVPKDLAKRKGQALWERADEALQALLGWDDPVDAESELPRLPLFSELEPEPLSELLAAFEVRELDGGQKAIEQGREGNEAFVVVRGVLEVVREGDERTVLAALGPGAIFGEMALVSDAPRAASVEAAEPVTLLVVSREKLEGVAEKAPAVAQELSAFCRGRMLANLMRHSAILGAVHAQERQALMERFAPHHFEAGEALVEEGSEGQGLFLIASGGVEVVGKDADGDELRIAELGPGDVVGEISLVLRRPANATVRALHRTVALELTREEFQKAIKEHPTLLGELYEMATQREEETRTVVAQEALDVEDVVLL